MKALWLALVCVALLGCDKGSAPKQSGPLPEAEAALFKNLPAGGNVIFGGNYMKVQAWMQSTMGEAMAALGSGWKQYAECWASSPNVKLAGTAIVADVVEMRMAFTGMTLDEMKKCADKAGFKATLDGDGKYLSIQSTTLGMTTEQGLLQLANGAVYTRQSVGLGGGGIVPAKRADLEGDMAKLAQGTALDDGKLRYMVTKVDRSKTMWFAGTAIGTSIGDKLGEVYGAFDVVPGVTFDVTAELLDRALADKVMAGYDEMKKHLDQAPADMRAVFEGISLTRDGNRLRMRAKITDAQLAGFMKQLAMFRGGGM